MVTGPERWNWAIATGSAKLAAAVETAVNRMIAVLCPHLRRTAVLALALIGALALGAATAGADTKRAEIGRSAFGNYLAGRHAQTQKDLSAAADFLGAALKSTPDAPDLLRRTFVLSLIEGRMTEARGLAHRLLRVSPDSQLAHLTLAVDEIKAGRFAVAGKRLGRIESNGIGSFTAPVLKAWSLVGEKKAEDALKLLEATPKENTLGALHTMHAAMILEMIGRNDEAIKKYLAVIEDQKSLSMRIAQFTGALYERMGKAKEAEALYRRYKEEQPGSQLLDGALDRLSEGDKPTVKIFSVSDGAAEALFGITSSLRQQNAREMALVMGRLALHLKPRFPVLQILLADVLEADGRLEAALDLYNAIDKDSPFSWSARLRVGTILDELKRTDDAVKHLRRMARDRKSDPGPLIQLGNVLRGHERFAEAVKVYDEALGRIPQLESRHWTLLYARGIALERSKQWGRAEADFRKALAFEPEQPYVLNYLGYSWIDQGKNLKQAQDMIKKAASLRPNDGYIIDSLGWGHYRLGNYAEAVRQLERAVELRPEDPIINDHLGDAYWRVGRKREAIFQWNRSLSLEPEKDLIKTIEKKLIEGLGKETETAKTPGKDG